MDTLTDAPVCESAVSARPVIRPVIVWPESVKEKEKESAEAGAGASSGNEATQIPPSQPKLFGLATT